MSSNSQIDQLDAYHLGKMSEEELSNFEKELGSNPSLRSESEFQSSVIEGIKLERKSQLKTRLSAVDLSPGWFEFAQQSTLVKSFGGVAIATLVGTGVYFVADKKEVPVEELILSEEIGVTFQQPFDYNWNLPESKTVSVTEEVNSSQEPATIVILKAEEQPEELTIANVADTEDKEYAPDFTAPSADNVEDEVAPKSNALESVPTLAKAEAEEAPIEIETKNSRSSKIKYKYYDGKLFLDGDFNKKPYEIIEINSAKARRIYLLHIGTFYEIKINDRLTELPEVNDPKLIQELQLIRANK